MALVKPFCCVRPEPALAARVAALPYDVYNRQEAKEVVEKNPLSFLAIDRAETGLPDSVSTYDDQVYARAKELFEARVKDGTFLEDPKPAYYLYELTRNGVSQTGIVGCSAVDDYLSGVIKKHENTREEKEIDRIRHIDSLNAQTGPIFLTYRQTAGLSDIVAAQKKKVPLYDFVAVDGVVHRVWEVDSDANARIQAEFAAIPATYIADGHHRAASAVKVALKRREEHPGAGPDAEFNFFLSVLFPENELSILPYNRVVKDLAGLTEEAFFEAVSASFTVERVGRTPVLPEKKGTFGMYVNDVWYRLCAKSEAVPADPVGSLDVSVLQDRLLGPVLKIGDPRTDKRIDFVGGIRGLGELERRVHSDMKIAFSMYPTSMEELLSVADAGLLMPPKSTWFEPKLRSGLFIHRLGEQ